MKPTFDAICGLISDILNGIGDIVDWIGNFFTSLWDFFVNLFKSLFVPSDNYFTDKVNGVTETINSKVGVDVSTLETLKCVGKAKANIDFIIKFTLFNQECVIDLDFIKQAQPYSQALFMGLSSIFLCWYNYKNVLYLFGKQTAEGFKSNGGNNK